MAGAPPGAGSAGASCTGQWELRMFVVSGPGLRPWQNQVEDSRRTKGKVKGVCVCVCVCGGPMGARGALSMG